MEGLSSPLPWVPGQVAERKLCDEAEPGTIIDIHTVLLML